MNIYSTSQSDFKNRFNKIVNRSSMEMNDVMPVVSDAIARIRKEGDKALFEDVSKFDAWTPHHAKDLEIDRKLMSDSYEALEPKLRDALHIAYDRIFSYHKKQKQNSWFDTEDNGTILGQKVTAVDRAGLYIPGGKASYPSSLLMNAIPALVAGVKDIIVCTPTPKNEPNSLLLAACHLCGIEKVYKVGGASAIATMAYGTKSIKKVDVITGPGNIFVATAKKMVYGDVNIDMIAGPSEIGILADESANPNHLAIDLLSQAEHDEMASSIMITTSQEIARQTSKEVEIWLKKLRREKIARTSIEERGAIIVAYDMDEAISLMNEIAPEHLEVVTQNPHEYLGRIKHAGAIFLGANTPEAIGDYIAGPNHTLPTGSTAKFYSPLGVEHFMKKTSIIAFSNEAINELGEHCALLADIEGLDAHAASVRVRLK